MRFKNVYPEMTSFESLRRAYAEIAKGKGEKYDTLRFEYDLEANLHELSADLRQGKVPKVRYKSFYVYVPKLRKVIYIDYTSKIIQRAIYDAINPRLEKTFIPDTYACLPGRGQQRAMLRIKQWMEETRSRPGDWFYFKYDVSKFFYRIDHEILIRLLEKRFRDRQLIDLMTYYIDGTDTPFGLPLHKDTQEITQAEMLYNVGIPIGGGLSHTLGNLYLDPLDQFIKRDLRCEKYARYMDDGIIFDNDKHRLQENGARIEEFTNERLALEFNQKTALRPARCGVEWVGYDIYDDHIRLRKSSTLHMKRRLAKTMQDYHDGKITLQEAAQTVASYAAMMQHCDMDRFREHIWNEFFVLTKGDIDEARRYSYHGIII